VVVGLALLLLRAYDLRSASLPVLA
jgi:hypothetical protein